MNIVISLAIIGIITLGLGHCQFDKTVSPLIVAVEEVRVC